MTGRSQHSQPSATVLAMDLPSEFCGKQRRTARNESLRAIRERSRRWSPASSSRSKPEKAKKKRKEKRKQEGETPTDAYATARTSARARPIGGARLSAFHHGACCSERTPQLNSSHALPVKVLRRNGRYPFPAFVQCSGLVTRGPVIVPAGRVCRSRLGAAVTSRRAQEPSHSDQPSHRLTFLTSGMFGLMLAARAPSINSDRAKFPLPGQTLTEPACSAF